MYEMIEMVAMAFTLGLTGALAPGPTLVATVNSSLKSGWTAGPKIAVGHALVEVLIFLLIREVWPWRHSSILITLPGQADWP